MIMKQRLLYAFLMLFAVAGMARAANVTVKVTSNGGKAVMVTSDKDIQISNSGSEAAKVVLSANNKSVTIDQGYQDEVTLTSSDAVTLTVTGNMTKLDVGDAGSTLKTLTLASSNYVQELVLSAPAMESLTCSGLGLETLTLTGSTALKTLNASDNKLSSVAFPSGTALEKLDLSKNLFTSLTLSSLTGLKDVNVAENQLEDLDVLSLVSLTKLNLSDNQILKLTNSLPASLKENAITWGIQKVSISSAPDKATDANKGFRIPNLIEAAGISTDPNVKYTNVSWQVLDGTKYVDDNGKTAHQQSGAWANEYRFYDATTKEYVKGTYQCMLTTGGRIYKITDLDVWTAKFNLAGVLPKNATVFDVSIDGANAVAVVTNPQVKQGSKLLFILTPAAGYETAEYTIEGMVPASSAQKPPYKGTSFECIVKGLYKSQSEEVSPKISAVVLGKEHTVSYESKTQEGGSFTVQKVSGTTTSNMEPGASISTGDKLLIKIKPKTGYDFVLSINGVDKTTEAKLTGSEYVYSEDITDASYADTKTITVNVTFKNPSVKGSVKVDGQALGSTGVDYIDGGKVQITTHAGGTPTEVTNGNKFTLVPNTTYQAIFTIGPSTSNTANIHRLKDITINGGEVVSINKDSETGNKMKYTVAFKVEASEVVISITTKKMQTVGIVPVVNDGGSGQKQTYDGKEKPVLFSTVPAGLEEHVKVTYETDATPSSDMGETKPVNAGKYKATLTFEETDLYIPDAQSGTKTDFVLEIEKAPLTIETLPTITVHKSGKYEVSGGKVTFNKEVITGSFTTNPSVPANPGISHLVEVTFTPTSTADKANFKEAKATVNVLVGDSDLDLYKVTMVTLPAGYSIQWLNGNKPVDITKETFAENTKLTAIVSYPKGTKGVELKLTSEAGKSVISETSQSVDGTKVYTVTLKEATEFKVVAGTGNQYTIQFKKQQTDYTGEPLTYDPEKGLSIFDADKHAVEWSTISSNVTVTYKDASGNKVAQPVDAGTYTVCVSIKADDQTGYIETVAEEAVFVVNQIKPLVYKWPVGSVIAKGQALAQSDLTEGAANIPGTFGWKNDKETFPIAGEYRRPVVFTPADSHIKNYLTVETRGGEALGGDGVESNQWVKFTVSDLQIVTFSQTEGTITVTNQLGQSLKTGSAVTKGDVLTITVVPREGLELKSLMVNGASNSGTYKVGDSSVAIEATFQPKVVEPEPQDPVIDPNSQYAVTLPKAVRGVAISKPGVNAVLKDKSFSFTLAALAADLNRIVVKANGKTLTPSNGTYTIAQVSGNTEVQISLADPTPLKVQIERETRNEKGTLIGKVLVNGPSDGVCYYNDEITLAATPEGGVTFGGWSDDKQVKDQLRTLVLTKDITIKPIFSGTPTGIESISTARVYGQEGYLVIEGVANGKVAVVSMNGRVQRHQVEGDSRIQLASGVYGVILEEGSNVIRTKVIVK